MKKYALMIALASVIAAPSHAQLAGETNVMKTETAVEKAARQQGFSSSTVNSPPTTTTGGTGSWTAAPAPDVIENTSVQMMAPEAPAPQAQHHSGVPVLSGTPAPYSGSRPSLIKNDLPAGLVMDGPGTEAYKKKHRKKKKKKVAAPVEQAAPVAQETPKEEPAPEPVKEEAAPAPEPAPVPVEETPPAMPDVTATPPVEEPAPAPEAADPLLETPAPETAPDMGMPAPGGLEPPDDPFATPPAP